MTQHADADVTTAAERRALFYEGVVAEAELHQAIVVRSLDPEIALLRATLRAHLIEHPEDLALMLRSVTLIVRAVAARYRMSDEHASDLGASLAKTIRLVGGQFRYGAADDA